MSEYVPVFRPHEQCPLPTFELKRAKCTKRASKAPNSFRADQSGREKAFCFVRTVILGFYAFEA